MTATPVPAVTLGAVNMEAEDPHALAAFWAEVTGGSPASSGASVYLPASGAGGFAMFFQPLTGLRPSRATAHLDLTVPWTLRVATVERLLEHGASRLWDVLEEYDHVQWTTMSDPEGNLFCVAEHPPARDR